MTSLAAVVYALFGREDWWKRQQHWLKYFSLPVMDGAGNPVYRIPMDNIAYWRYFGAPMLAAIESIDKKDPKALRDVFARLLAKDTPIDLDDEDYGGSIIGMIPQVFRPTVEALANYDSFSGRRIESLKEQEAAAAYRYRGNTSELAKGMGRFLRASPIMLEHLLQKHTAGLGTTILRNTPFIGAAHPTAADMPGLGRFTYNREYSQDTIDFSSAFRKLRAEVVGKDRVGEKVDPADCFKLWLWM
jgi:hypothetical protein